MIKLMEYVRATAMASGGKYWLGRGASEWVASGVLNGVHLGLTNDEIFLEH